MNEIFIKKDILIFIKYNDLEKRLSISDNKYLYYNARENDSIINMDKILGRI